MTLDELKQYLLVNSNQYFIGEENLFIDDNVINNMIKRALIEYGNYKPIKKILQYSIENNITKIDKITLEDGTTREVQSIKQIYIFDPLYQKIPIQWHWHFNEQSKTLKIQALGTYYIEFLVFPALEDINSYDNLFLDMVLGLYLMYVASTRKSFTLSELPFDNDADDLASMGREIFTNAKEQLQTDNSNWWEAYI